MRSYATPHISLSPLSLSYILSLLYLCLRRCLTAAHLIWQSNLAWQQFASRLPSPLSQPSPPPLHSCCFYHFDCPSKQRVKYSVTHTHTRTYTYTHTHWQLLLFVFDFRLTFFHNSFWVFFSASPSPLPLPRPIPLPAHAAPTQFMFPFPTFFSYFSYNIFHSKSLSTRAGLCQFFFPPSVLPVFSQFFPVFFLQHFIELENCIFPF